MAIVPALQQQDQRSVSLFFRRRQVKIGVLIHPLLAPAASARRREYVIAQICL